MLVYGRNPRGPLTILKESWTEKDDTSASLAQPDLNCLRLPNLPRVILMQLSKVMLHIIISGPGNRNFKREIRSLCWPQSTPIKWATVGLAQVP